MSESAKPLAKPELATPRVVRTEPPTPLLVHGAILGLAVVAAVVVWTRDKKPLTPTQGDVSVWAGRASAVEQITYESKTRKVDVTAKSDALGRYFVGTLEKLTAHATSAVDAGPTTRTEEKTTVGFVSVGPGEKLADALGPLKGLRALGAIGNDRAADFGLADPEATVTIKLAGTAHRLLVGAPTPGGSDRYVREAASGNVYVLRGEPFRTLESADSLLLERELHQWKEAEVTGARLSAGGKTRALVRGGPEGKRFWADAASPDNNDETLGNWMSKLDRLRPTSFVLGEPEGAAPVLTVEYSAQKPLGVLEIAKTRGGEKPEYLVRTEHTRLYGKLAGPAVEQVEQDLGTIVK
jgi:hypothetical protein